MYKLLTYIATLIPQIHKVNIVNNEYVEYDILWIGNIYRIQRINDNVSVKIIKSCWR